MNRLFLAAVMTLGAAVFAASPAKVATRTVTKVERNYDCRLSGNKNKTACHSAANPAKPVVKQVTTATTTRNYDCTKAGNANKTVCKAATVAKTVAVAKPVAMPRPMAKVAVKPAASSDDRNPAGAIGRCKDGFYSHSKQREGACSRHGGVAKWA